MKTPFNELALSLAHLLLPRLCAACSRPLLLQEQVLCMSCTLELPMTGFHGQPENETSVRIAGRIPFQHATSLAWFQGDGLLQYLLHLLKYQARQDVGRFLGSQAAAALYAENWVRNLDAIVPLPLHAKKQSLRGFNQVAVMAQAMAAGLQLPVLEGALQRTRNTKSQTRMSGREQRSANVQGAFDLGPDGHALKGNNVLLMDDVLTTGATLIAAAEPLQRIQGLQLNIFTLGIATG